jgi:predicted phage terminase large subunit-like protein
VITVLRDLVTARLDPNQFVPVCFTDSLGRRVQQAAVHVELQRFLSDHPKALIELPRDHGKSFQVCCRVIWELGRNPGLRVKVVCATEAVAAERARFLRDAVAFNPWVRKVFPGLRPARPWAADAFTVARPTDLIGPSVAAFGVGAGSTGTRADLLVCDDVVDVRALHSRAERDRTADYFENNLMNLLEPDGRFWGLFTPWHTDDLNARLKRNEAYAVFSRTVGPDLEPVWPEKWSREWLLARKAEIGAASFARGYHLLPLVEEETPIRAAWVRFWTEPADYECVVLSVDPAVTASPKADASALVVLGKVGNHSPLTRTAAPSDLSPGGEVFNPFAVGAAGAARRSFTLSPAGEGGDRATAREPGEGVFDSGNQIHVLEATARRVAAPELVSLIDDADCRWNPGVILFESNAAFAGIRDLLVRHSRFGPKLKSVVQSKDKLARVAAFSVAVENGSFRLRGGPNGVDPAQAALFEEMTTFPFAEHDDLLDAAATGTAFLLDRREPRVW